MHQTPTPEEESTLDSFLHGRLLLSQPAKGHRVGTDALLLSAATAPTGRICDLGAGVGAVGLALRLAGAERVVLVERDPIFARHARDNIARGRFGEVDLADVDLFDRPAVRGMAVLADQSFDAVATNPPFSALRTMRRSPQPLKQAAHMLEGGTLADWLRVAARLLRHGGVLTMIHRADALAEILAALPARLGGVALRPVQPTEEAAATRLLLRAVAGSRAPLTLLPPLVLHDTNGRFLPDAEAWHRGEARINWG